MVNKYNLYIITFLTCFIYIGNIDGQFVYPGDANQDSIANNIDVLYLGKAYGQTGAARTTVSISWELYDIPTSPWSDNIYGIPAYFSDCDGNGSVGDQDLEAVQVNYGLQYGTYVPVGEGDDPILKIEGVQDTIGLGDEMLFRVVMGSDTETFENVEGIAYTLRMGSSFNNFEVLLNFSDDNNWFVEQNEQLHLLKIQPLISMDVANTRIDQNGQTGFGEVSRLSYNIDKDLVGGLIDDYTPFTVGVENIIVSYSDRIDTLQGSIDTIYVGNANTTTSTNDFHSNEHIKVFPNPFSSHLNMIFERENIGKVKIIDSSGRLKFYLDKSTAINHLQITTEEWPQGIYIIHYNSKDSAFSEIFVKQ
ncbi:MAG: hypothetical protein ACI94Y_003946 [Maribacter sp.]|jgi:hypothetical protein